MIIILFFAFLPIKYISADNSVHLRNFTNSKKILIAKGKIRKITPTTKTKKTKDTKSTKKDESTKNNDSKKGMLGSFLGGMLGGAILGAIFGHLFGNTISTFLTIALILGIIYAVYKFLKARREKKINQIVEDRIKKEKGYIYVDPK